MKIHYLHYLIDIASTNSINLSAERLFISQQSLSKAIKSMEQELGVPLLTRAYNGVTLTEQGKIVVKKGQLIVNLLKSIESDLQHFQACTEDSLIGELRIKANYQATISILPSAIQNFSKKHPLVQLKVDSCLAFEVVRDVYMGKLQMGIIGIAPTTIDQSKNYREMFDALHSEVIYKDQILVCLSKSLLLSQKEYFVPKDLTHIPLISFGHPPVNDVIFADAPCPTVLLETSSIDLFKKTIQQGLGFGLSNSLDYMLNYSKLDKQSLAFVPIKIKHNALIHYVVYNEETLNSRICVEFINTLREFGRQFE